DGAHEFTMDFVNLHSQDDFRINFLKKLSYKGVWVPRADRPPQHQTVIIFDWDDTLLCTTYLNMKPDSASNASVQRHLQSIVRTTTLLLETALRHAHTFIITNAIRGWVEYSCTKYIPALMPVIRKIKVISARGDHEQQFPGNYHEWKIQAFLNVQRE